MDKYRVRSGKKKILAKLSIFFGRKVGNRILLCRISKNSKKHDVFLDIEILGR